MRNIVRKYRQHLEFLAFCSGVLFVVIACGLLIAHASLFQVKREHAISIGLTLPELESSVALLKADIEAERLFLENGLASREELADAYILPLTSPTPRLVESLTSLETALTKAGSAVHIEKISVDQKFQQKNDLKEYHVHLILRGTYQTVARLLGILAFSGDMMVKDVLSTQTETALLASIETIAPLTLGGTENFLYTDLLDYASEPDLREQRMFGDIPTDTAAELRSMLLRAGLAHVRTALGDIAASLRDHRAWPFPLLQITNLTRSADRWMIDLTVYGR